MPRIIVQFEARTPIRDVVACPRGAIISGSQTAGNTLNVHAGHEILSGHKMFYSLDPLTNISVGRIYICTGVTATSVTFSGLPFAVENKAAFVTIGSDTVVANADGSWPLPEWDATLTTYSDPNLDTPNVGGVNNRPDGRSSYWIDAPDIPHWAIGRNSAGAPESVIVDIGASDSAASSTTTRSVSAPLAPNIGDIWIRDMGSGKPDISYIRMEKHDATIVWTEFSRAQSA